MSLNLPHLYNTYIQDFSFPFHQDSDSFYFFLILDGTLSISIDDNVTNMETNDFITILPDEKLKVINQSRALVHVFKVSWEVLVDIIPNYDRIKCNSKKYPSEFHNDLIRDYINLVRIPHDDVSDTHALCVSNLYKFLYTLSLLIIPDEMLSDAMSQDEKYKTRIKNIRKFLNSNYMNPIKLNELSEYLYITPQYTSNFMKKYMKISFQKLLTEIRVHKAAQELLSTNNTITKIAYNCGFTNIQSFNKSFKAAYSTSPKLYRQKFLKQTQTLSKEPAVSEKNKKLAKTSLENLITSLDTDKLFYQKSFDINVKVDESPKSFSKRIWQETINLGFCTNLMSSTFQSHISDVQKNLHFRYGRIQGILNSSIIDRIPKSNSYNFSNFNRIIDFLYTVNILPFIEFGDKPQKLNIKIDEYLFISNMETSRMENTEWDRFINLFLSNCINRYGRNEVAKWKFEMWLPHSKVLSYTDTQITLYSEHYSIMYHNVKGILPDIQIGGFGFNAAARIQVIKKVLAALAEKNAKFDFFSFSSFHILSDENNMPLLTSNETYLEDSIIQIKQALHPYKLPLYLTEFTFDVTTRNYMHDSVFQALYLIRNIIRSSNELKAIAFWNLSDLTAEYKDINRILFGGNGIVSVDGLHKPVFYAYKFLSYLGNNIIDEGKHHIITSKGAGSYQILIFNYVHPSELSTYKYVTDFQPYDVNDIFMNPTVLNYNINVSVSTPGKYRVKSYLLNSIHGSIIDEWCRLGTDNTLESSELDYLKNICVPKQDIQTINVQSHVNIQGLINPNEIIIYRVRIEL